MAVARSMKAQASQVLILAALASFPSTQAATALPTQGVPGEPFRSRFDPIARETRLTGRIALDLCFSLTLPREWHLERRAEKARLTSAAADVAADLEVGLRSAHEIQHMPEPDLARRDAAFLQQGYEHLLGRPAQSVSLSASDAGAMRWSATWVDANLPADSHALTVETFIVPLSREWLLELSLTDVEMPEVRDALMRRVLADLKVERGVACDAGAPLAGRHLSSR
ncbi:hypothetical protein [Microvirga roseola]|uniref:hypothetical protein n=1 Tax=Microvirga roseola TaxID=2883126 RepID=UPI001E3E9EB4|nr:hypothetical protein [Microvirga roseola]